MLTLGIYNNNDELKQGALAYVEDPIDLYAEGEEVATLGITDYTYVLGDKIKVTVDEPNQYYVVQLDETLNPDLIFIKENE